VIVIAHQVKCTVCGQTFDRDKVQAVKTGARRYAHYKCKPDGEIVPLPKVEVDKDLVDLENYIKKLLKEDYVNAKVRKQIKEYQQEYGYSYSGMLKSLIYFYEIKGNSVEKANGGIGIIPYVYKQAYDYYFNLFMAKQQNEKKDISYYIKKVKEVTIKPPNIKKKIKFFNFEKEEDNNETSE
jgi:hypothetical protein